MSTRSAKGGGAVPPRFHVAPEQAALRAQLVHPDAARGRFGRTTTATATAEDDYPQDEPRGGGGEVRMVKMTGRKDRHATHSPSPTTAMLEDDLIDGGDDDDDEDEEGGGGGGSTSTATTTRKARFPNKRNAQSVGRRKIHIEFIEDKPRRHVTFTKRKSGLMKKAYELSTLTGTDCLVVVVSESGLLYTFSTPALSGVTDHPRGREFLEAALRGEIRGDGTGDFDFVGAAAGGGGGGGDGGDATGGGSARGEKRRRGGATTARGMSGEGDQRMDEQQHHHMGGISVGNAAAAAADAFQQGMHNFAHSGAGTGAGAGDEFQLDPALHGLDLPVPPLPYPHPSHPHAQQQQQQQQLFDFLNFGGASNNVGGGDPSQQQQGGEFGTTAPPHAYTTTATTFSPSSHSFFSPPPPPPPPSLQPPSIPTTAASMAAHQPSHDHDPHGRLFPLPGGAASTTSAATTALSDHLSFPTTSSGAVGSSLFEHGSLGFPLGAGRGGGGTNPLPPPPLATTSFASTSTSSSAPPPPPPPPFSGAPSGPATDREAVARAHELATKSYRAALSAAEAYTSASPPPPAVGGSSSSSSSSSSASNAGGGDQVSRGGPGADAADPNRGRGKTFPRFDQFDMNELMLVSGGGGGGSGGAVAGPSSAGGIGGAPVVAGRRKRSAGAMLPLDASEMGWDRSSSSSTMAARRVRSRLDGEGEDHAEATNSRDAQERGAHDGRKEADVEDDEEEEESAEERKFRWQKEARKALKEAQKNPTIPSFLRAHAYSHYSLRPYPPRFDASKPLYSLAGVDDAPAMMWASFARMCCRSGVEDKLEMVGAVQEFLSRWLPHEMLRNPSFHPSFLVPALSHARSGLLSLLDYLEAHSLLTSSESDRVSAVLSGQIRPQAGYEEVLGLGREREGRLYGQPVAVAAASAGGGGGVAEGGMELEKSTHELGEAETGNGAEGLGGEEGGAGEQQQQQPVAQERVEATG